MAGFLKDFNSFQDEVKQSLQHQEERMTMLDRKTMSYGRPALSAAVEMDADLEDPPHVIPRFVAEWEKGYDVVYGVRATRHAPWLMKFFFSAFYRLLNRLSSLDIPENSGDFRLLDQRVLKVLRSLPERNLYLRGLVSYLGFKQKPVVYHREPRISGRRGFPSPG